LSALAAAVDAFYGNQFSGGGHVLAWPETQGAIVETQSNRRHSALQRCAC
jgi:hypothetical protein